MTFQYTTPYIFFALTSTIVSLGLAYYAWACRSSVGVRALLLMGLATSVWSLGYTLELGGTDLVTKFFWVRVQYFGIVTVPVAWIWLVLDYTGRQKLLTLRNQMFLAIIPVMTLIFVWTNEQLIWRHIALDVTGSFPVFAPVYGPWMWVNSAYSYVLLLLGSILLLNQAVRSQTIYHRRQVVFLLLSIFIPWVGNALYTLGFKQLDWMPFAFALSGLIMAWGVLHLYLFDIKPVARKIILDNLHDGIFVLDKQNRIVDVNLAGQNIAAIPVSNLIGQPLDQIDIGNQIPMDHNSGLQGMCQIEIVHEGSLRYYNLEIFPLLNCFKKCKGRLVTLQDITERVLAEKMLAITNVQLQQSLAHAKDMTETANALCDSATDLSSTLTLEEVLDRILKNISNVIPHDMINIMLIEDDVARVFRYRGYPKNEIASLLAARLPIADLPNMQEMIRTRQPLIIPDVNKYPGWMNIPNTSPVYSHLGAPIHVKEITFGFLSLNSKMVNFFTPVHGEQLRIFAAQAAVAIENARLYERAQEEIADRRRAELALRESEERYNLAARGANDGLWDWNLQSDKIYFSPRWKELLGYEEDEIGNMPEDWFRLVHPDDLHSLKTNIRKHVTQKRATHLEHEYRVSHQDGTYCWMLCRGLAVFNEKGDVYRLVGSQTDITSRRKAEQQLRYDALHDALTDLPNRNSLIHHTRRVLERARRDPDYLFAVLLLNLDRFRMINDNMGRQVGDELIIIISQRIKACLRPGDMLARQDGDEFAVLLDGLQDENEAVHIVKQIQKKVSKPINLTEKEVSMTTSVGIALNRVESQQSDYMTPEDLLRNAAIAMNQAKLLDLTRYAIFDFSMRTRALARFEIETGLQQAFDQQAFIVLYQPIVSLVSNRIVSVEALLRWEHPQLGFISPEIFIPVAEETGLIIPISEWLLNTVCTQIKAWHDAGCAPSSTAVNISIRQFQDVNLSSLIMKILEKTGLNADMLKFEITESAIMEDSNLSQKILTELKDLGLHIAIDDFGTGYSSLSRLQSLPVDTLKIDQSFVKKMITNSNVAMIVTSTITMAHNLGIKVIAEGVEAEEQLCFLQLQHCDEVQGYFFSQPLSARQTTKILQENKVYHLSSLPIEMVKEQLVPNQALRHIGYALADKNLTILTSNTLLDQWVNHGGYNTLVGQHLLDVFPELVGVEDVLYQLSTGQIEAYTISMISRSPDSFSVNDNNRYIELRVESFLEANASLLIMVTDVTDQAQLEYELRQEYNDLRLMVAKQGTVLESAEGNIR
ncbi:MAG: hypothetical protein CSA11_03770 [Chloroflexi bacterium]|nr:MAG: hypothetical protein CSA11_03770 [Chloroflexota bacterium]